VGARGPAGYARERGKEERGERLGWGQGKTGPGVAHVGRKGERGNGLPGRERGRPKKESRPGCWALSLSSSFLILSTLKLFKQFYLNSNKFEFKPYTLNTNNTMLQHECTNKLIL
jgi:hypothetical protein